MARPLRHAAVISEIKKKSSFGSPRPWQDSASRNAFWRGSSVRLNRAVPLEMMLLVACGLLACAPPHAVSRTPEVVVLSDASAGSPPSTSTPGPQGAADGARCDRAGECKSGNCVDHVCCESACAGTCLACDRPGAEGQCLPVPEGQDPDNECAE